MGSSKLELPTSQKRGSSVTVKPPPGPPNPDSGSSAASPLDVRIRESPSAVSLGLSDVASPNGVPGPPPQIGVVEGTRSYFDQAAAPRSLAELPTAISTKPPLANAGANRTNSHLIGSLAGHRLLHFEVEEYVGGGGMGAVFRGHDTTLGRTVAIKVLSQENADEDMIRRFQHEARSAAKLDHPSIPHVYFVGAQDGWYFIVFEFIQGENIRDIVANRGPLSIREAVSYLADVAEAVEHASDRNVVHRDVKPSNVLVTRDGCAKLVDMGLARSERIQSTANELTATGVTLGTFDYISPEQARDPRSADTRSDIYSLGCTLYFMLTGRPPFPDGTMLQKLLRHTSDSPPSPSEFRSDVPDRLTEMLARMLAKNPDHRYQSAAELLGEIVLLAHDLGIPLQQNRPVTIVVEHPVVGPTGWRRHVPWLAPLLILLLTALGLQLWQPPNEAPPNPISATVRHGGDAPPDLMDNEIPIN